MLFYITMDKFEKLQDDVLYAHELIVQACKAKNKAVSSDDIEEAEQKLINAYKKLESAEEEYNMFCYGRK